MGLANVPLSGSWYYSKRGIMYGIRYGLCNEHGKITRGFRKMRYSNSESVKLVRFPSSEVGACLYMSTSSYVIGHCQSLFQHPCLTGVVAFPGLPLVILNEVTGQRPLILLAGISFTYDIARGNFAVALHVPHQFAGPDAVSWLAKQSMKL